MARGFYDHGTDDIWPSLRDLQLSTTKNTVVLMVRLPFSVLDFRCLRNTRNFWDSGTEKPSIRIVGILRSAETINRFFVVPDLELQNFCKQFQRPNAVSIPRVCWLKKRAPHVLNNWTGCKKNSFAKKTCWSDQQACESENNPVLSSPISPVVTCCSYQKSWWLCIDIPANMVSFFLKKSLSKEF